MENLFFSKTHEWVKFEENGDATIGITDHAQESLGDIVFLNLPMIDEKIEVEGLLGNIESIKAVSDIFSPISGTVKNVNQNAIDEPELINSKPYETWLIELTNVKDRGNLMSYEEYKKFIEEE